jgi:hypothetical protein
LAFPNFSANKVGLSQLRALFEILFHSLMPFVSNVFNSRGDDDAVAVGKQDKSHKVGAAAKRGKAKSRAITKRKPAAKKQPKAKRGEGTQA